MPNPYQKGYLLKSPKAGTNPLRFHPKLCSIQERKPAGNTASDPNQMTKAIGKAPIVPTASPKAFIRHQNHLSHASGKEKTIRAELVNNTQESSFFGSMLSPRRYERIRVPSVRIRLTIIYSRVLAFFLKYLR